MALFESIVKKKKVKTETGKYRAETYFGTDDYPDLITENTPVEEIIKNKTTKELIEEIHETFYSEVDRLKAKAEQQEEYVYKNKAKVDKGSRLKSLGFTATKTAIEAEEELKQKMAVETENNEKQELVDAINYFSQKYPLYKFITEESVKKICEKYGLVYGDVSLYTGTVPDKNLSQIENFTVEDDDYAYCYTRYGSVWGSSSWRRGTKYFCSKKNLKKQLINQDVDDSEWIDSIKYSEYKAPFEIAAPVSDFNMEDMEVSDFKIREKVVEIPDPVVLQPVMYNNTKHYLIVTAWGDEAEDELVMNQNFN